eukprot:s1806_g9.t1
MELELSRAPLYLVTSWFFRRQVGVQPSGAALDAALRWKIHWGAHPPLQGIEWFLSDAEFAEHTALHGRGHPATDPGGGYISRSTAAYPADLNRYLAQKFALAGRPQVPQISSMIVCGRWGNTLVRREDYKGDDHHSASSRYSFSAPLRGLKDDGSEGRFVGGMRHPRKALGMQPGLEHAGRHIRDALLKILGANSDMVERCVGAVGSHGEHVGPTTEDLQLARQAISQCLPKPQLAPQYVANSTKLQADLLLQWGSAAHDPDASFVHDWLVNGSPAGIEEQISDPGVFPPNDESGRDTDYFEPPDAELHANYSSVDGDPAAATEVQRLFDTGFVKVFDSLEECQQWAGGKLHLSKLAMITKVKEGRTKRRLIMDCRRSSVNALATRGGKLILPRIVDVVDDLLYLLDQLEGARGNPELEMMVLDFTDWFYQVPLAHAERKYFAFKFGNKYAVYLTQPQGSRNAPVVCGRVAAYIGRLTQGVIHACNMRLQIYVDDPIISAIGTREERRLHFALLILLWEAMGIGLAYKKGAIGREVSWIGATFRVKDIGTSRAAVLVTAKQDMVDEVRAATSRHGDTNFVTKKELASYTGKLNHIAGMIEMLRPFLTELYGALHSKDANSNAPPNMVWTKQWSHTRLWLLRLLQQEGQTLAREYRVHRYFGRGRQIRIVTDASPWGIGGYMAQDTSIVKHFAMPLTSEDSDILGVEIGSPDTQQVVDALALFVALKLWETEWKRDDTCLTLQLDSVSALSLIYKLRTAGNRKGSHLLAKELALLMGSCAYKPIVMEHIPGLSNKLADHLSRIAMPGFGAPLPEILKSSQLERTVIRDANYYTTLRPLRKGDV